MLPLLTDSQENLRSVAIAAKAAGAQHFGAGVLFLKPAARQIFFQFLAEHYPELLARYRARYRSGAYLKGAYPDRIAQRVEEIRCELGFGRRDISFWPAARHTGAQLKLF